MIKKAAEWLARRLFVRPGWTDKELAGQPPLPETCRRQIRELLSAIADSDYEAVDALVDANSRTQAGTIAEEVFEYGAEVTRPPDDYFEVHVPLVMAREQPDGRAEWFVAAPLWTRQEGRSDLELRIVVTEEAGECRMDVRSILVP